MINTVLFDFDGTLVNTNDVIIESWQHTYMHYTGKKEDLKKITSCFGEPLLVTMAREFPDVDPEESAEVYRRYQVENAERLVKIFPGMVELLEELKKRNYRIAIVTSRTAESCERYLKMLGIEEYFEGKVTMETTSIHKPEPEPILAALRMLNISKEEAIMIGDGPFDIKCANNAGVKSVLVGWRVTGDGSKLVQGAVHDYEILEPMELISVLEKENGK